MTLDSLRKRYFYKLAGNLAKLGLNVSIYLLVPRALGPKSYGDFSFLSNFFQQVVAFLDLGTSTAFFTKLSQRPNEFSLVTFYLRFTASAFLLTLGLCFMAQITGASPAIWPEQGMLYVYLAAIWGFLTWMDLVLTKMADAYGLTVSGERARIVQVIFGLVVIVALFFLKIINLATFFLYHFAILVLLAVLFIHILEKNGRPFRGLPRLPWAQVRSHLSEFYHYCHPLFSYALVGLVVGILDRYLLQLFGGSIQQGFFGLSFQIGLVCFMFTSAMTPLFTREQAIHHGQGDLAAMARIFRRYIPLLYMVSAYFGSFILIQAPKVTWLFGGEAFQGAAVPMSIMAIYPVHQTYGQLSGAVFLATGRTDLYRNIGIVTALLGLPMTYFLLAPQQHFGMGAGAVGLAVKMILLQFIAVNVQLFFNCRFLKLSFWYFLGHQVLGLGILIALAWAARAGVEVIPFFRERILADFFLSGVIYSLLALALFFIRPELFGLTPEDTGRLLEQSRLMLNRLKSQR